MLKNVLLVEDNAVIAETYYTFLTRGGYDVRHVANGQAALTELQKGIYPLVLLDMGLPDISGMKILEQLQSQIRLREVAVVVATADGALSNAVEAMRRGAHDFLVKPFNADRLLTTVANAYNTLNLQQMVQQLRDKIARDRFGEFIGGSLPMQLVYKIIEAAAGSKATVFITGESGTGKEVATRTIHNASRRKDGPFVAINCAAIPRDLMESELFGHVKGAFTGATSDRRGAVERAGGGTLFLDEVCEMPLDLQTKLLRFLQSNSYQPVGADDVKAVDCRIVCATNRDPLKEVLENRFREDLYYRLHVVPLHLPPLRDRRDDILILAQEILKRCTAEEHKKFMGFAEDAAAQLRTYDWPGNVRQLQNIIQQIVVLHDGELVTKDMLPPPLDKIIAAAPDVNFIAPSKTILQPLWRVEKDIIERAIAACDGNVTQAAEYLEISPSTIYRKRGEWVERSA